MIYLWNRNRRREQSCVSGGRGRDKQQIHTPVCKTDKQQGPTVQHRELHSMKGKEKWVTQSCLTLCDPMEYTVHGILQPRILKWVAVPFSSGSYWPRNWTGISCITGEFFTSWATSSAQFSSLQSLSRVQLFATPWTAAHQASLSITNSRSLLKLMIIESVMPSNHLILCRPLLLPPLIFPSIRVFSSESVLHQVAKGLEF